MKHKYLLKCLLLLFFIPQVNSFAQVNLSAGDIVLLQYNSDGGADELVFLPLVNIPGNSIIYFSDGSWDSGTSDFGLATERGIKYTVASGGLSAGTLIKLLNPTEALYELSPSSLGSLEFFELDGSVETGTSRELTLSTSGDQVLIFQTSDGVVTSTKTFIYGFNSRSAGSDYTNGWRDNGVALSTTSTDSHLPTGLTALNSTQTNKTTATAFGIAGLNGAHKDNWQYTGSFTATDKSGWLDRIHTLTNWSNDDTTVYSHSDIASGGTSVTVNGASLTWDGSTDNDWGTAANWTPEFVPSSGSDVTIPSGLTNYPTTGAIAVTTNTITIASGATLDSQSATSFTGTVTYNRALGTTNWYLVSSPVSGEDMGDMRANNSFKTNGSSEVSFAPYDNSQAVANDRWAYFGNTSTTALMDGKGYSASLSASGNISFTGTINTSDVTIALTQGGGSGTNFNLLGNPFTAYINSGTFLTNETGDLNSETIWLWDQSGNGGAGEYVTKVTADAFKVAPGQGFFVEASSTNNVTFTEAMQSHESTDTFQRNGRTEVHILMNDGTNNKFAKLYYIDGTTTGFDNGYDGELFGGVSNPFAIYTHLLSDSQGKNYQVQSLPSSDYENMIVPVGVNAVAGKELTFSANAMNLPSGINVYLEDKLTNTFTRLDETNSEYKVTLNNDLNGIGRFYVHTSSQVLNTPNFDLNSVSIYKTSKTNVRVTGLQSGNTTMNLYNILGKKVHSNSFIAKSVNDINLPVLNTGVYIVQLTTEQGKINKKIIIE